MTEPTTLRIRLDAPVDDVWHALTDTDRLREWLAEHARVHLPDTYEFWGRYTPDGAEPGQRLLSADGTTLRFAWRLGGTDTEVAIHLESETPTSTVLTLTQTNLPGFGDMVAGTDVLSLVYTFWALALANLADHVAGRPLTGRCDYTSTDLRADVVIDADRHAVYDSIADPSVFGRWFGVHVDAEPRVGGHWAMGTAGEPAATIVRLDADSAMAIEWPDGMVETWELDGSRGRTRLTYVQSGFTDDHPPYGSWAGTVAGLAELRRYHEIPGWRPMWLAAHVPGTPEGVVAIGESGSRRA
jgi:uncharacterized protein YndB with AHSA1/START domain